MNPFWFLPLLGTHKIRTTQEEIRTKERFWERTDELSVFLAVSLRSLAPIMDLSVASLFGYRNGSIPISRKAWSKLEQAERAAGIDAEESASESGNGESFAKPNQSLPPESDLLSVLTRIADALEAIVIQGDQTAAEKTSSSVHGQRVG